jgi:RNA recognition motif-containing protein
LANLDYSISEQDLMDFLADYQPVRAKLLYDESARSKGTGFVQMASPDYARMAIQDLSNQLLNGRKVIMNPAFNQTVKAQN